VETAAFAQEHVLGDRTVAAFKRMRRAVVTIEERAEFLDRIKDLRLDKPEGAFWGELASAAEEMNPRVEELRFFSQLTEVAPMTWPFTESAKAVYNQDGYQPRHRVRVLGAGAMDHDVVEPWAPNVTRLPAPRNTSHLRSVPALPAPRVPTPALPAPRSQTPAVIRSTATARPVEKVVELSARRRVDPRAAAATQAYLENSGTVLEFPKGTIVDIRV
jgi:hypothetical protein